MKQVYQPVSDGVFKPSAVIEKVLIDGEPPTKANVCLLPDNPEEWALGHGFPDSPVTDMAEPPESLHVTLKFLGDLPTVDERKRIEAHIEELARTFAPVTFLVTASAMYGRDNDVLSLELESTTASKLFHAVDDVTPESPVKWPTYKAHMALMYCKDERTKNMPVGKLGPASHLVGKTLTCSAIACQWGEDMVPVKLTGIGKGDFAGHPFRGNQWTGGGAVMFAADKGGGGGALRGTKPRRPVPAAMHQALDSEIEAFNAGRKKENEKRKAFNAKLGKDGTGKKPLLDIIQAVWTDVHISDAPGGKPSKYVENGLLATGISTDGKPKYIYSEEHHAAARGSKFAQVAEVEKLIPKIDSALDSMVAKNSGPTADALALIRYMGFRVGGDGESLDRATGKKIKTYGATTLEARHVRISPAGNKVTFNFLGKGGHTQKHSSSDPTVVQAARNGLARTKKPSDRLFPDVTDSSTIELLRKVSGHPKLINHNLRTRLATVRARDWLADAMDEYDPPKTPAEKKAWLKEMASDISEVIGDTPTVTISTYIDPTVYEPILGSYK